MLKINTIKLKNSISLIKNLYFFKFMYKLKRLSLLNIYLT